MQLSGQNYIDGNWRSGRGEQFTSENPATGQSFWSGSTSTQADVDDAIQSARGAIQQWRKRSVHERIYYLESFREELETKAEELAKIISQEVGKPVWEAKTEVQAMIGKIGVSIEAYEKRAATEKFALSRATASTRYKSLGVVAVLGPFNFPGHISNGHIIPALLAGNCVVWKPSELTPAVAELITHLWEASNIPKGVFNLVQGARETGENLVNHPDQNGVLFTGSLQAGIAISQSLASRPEVMLALELGGNNPLIVHEIDRVDAAVYQTIQSAFITSGQRCTCTRRLIVTPGNEKFIQSLVDTTKNLVVGIPDALPEPFMGTVINSMAVDKLLTEQEALAQKGGKELVQSRRLAFGEAFVSPGLIDVTEINDLPDEELFGPFLKLIRATDFESAIQIANQTRYGLAAGLLSKRTEDFEHFYNEIQAGIINWNSPTTGASGRLPFGGIGKSGNHRPAGAFMIDSCHSPVASIERDTMLLPEKLLPGVTLS